MLEQLKKNKLVIYLPILLTLVAGIYAALTPTVHMSKSQVALFRHKIEDPDSGSEESRNRWVWIRDGLNIKSTLLAETHLKTFLEKPEVKGKFAILPSDTNKAIGALKAMVNVQYTGADENNYIIEVKSTDAALALALNQSLFDRLKYLAVEINQADYESLKKSLLDYMETLVPASGEYTYFQNKIVKLNFEHNLEQNQRERAFQVITEPSQGSSIVWPKTLPLVALAFIAGLVLALAIEFLIFELKRKND
jgi:ABC-type Fe3+-siderophore transport system permease subunit